MGVINQVGRSNVKAEIIICVLECFMNHAIFVALEYLHRIVVKHSYWHLFIGTYVAYII